MFVFRLLALLPEGTIRLSTKGLSTRLQPSGVDVGEIRGCGLPNKHIVDPWYRCPAVSGYIMEGWPRRVMALLAVNVEITVGLSV